MMKKRITALLLALALVFTYVQAPVFAADSVLEDKDVYYTPASDYKSGDCILTATKTMIRRASILKKTGDWRNITNKSLRNHATIAGLLLNSFKFDAEGLVYRVESGKFTGKTDKARISEFASLLKTHPEGIVVHGTNAASSGTHGVLVVKVVNGVAYAADSSRNTGLYNKGIQKWSDTTMLKPVKVTKYWYISEISTSTVTHGEDGEETSALKIRSVRAPSKIKKGKGFTIKGTVTSDKKIKKVTVKILNSSGKKMQSASKSPNAKSFSIKKLDPKIRFGKLKKGKYTYQIIATDSVQTLTLVNKQFTVK